MDTKFDGVTIHYWLTQHNRDATFLHITRNKELAGVHNHAQGEPCIDSCEVLDFRKETNDNTPVT